jgi:hypothetical protein
MFQIQDPKVLKGKMDSRKKAKTNLKKSYKNHSLRQETLLIWEITAKNKILF